MYFSNKEFDPFINIYTGIIQFIFIVIRSQSVGPTVSDTSGSPKKQPKPMSASITAATASSAAKTHKKTPASTPTVPDHQARASKSDDLKFC